MINDKLSYTTAGRLKTSNQYPIFEMKHISNALETQMSTRIYGAIINHGTPVGAGFQVGEVITGGTSGMKGTITAVGSGNITYNNTVDYSATGGGTVGYPNNWADGETVTGGTSGTTATVTDHDTGAHCYYDYNTSSVRLKVGTLPGQKVIRQSMRYNPYFPSFEQSPTQTTTIEYKDNVKQYIVYGDSEDALGLMIDGQIPKVVLRSNVSGSPQEITREQPKWVDGHGLDLQYGQILSSYLKWLGYGNAGVDMTIDGVDRELWEFLTAGKLDDVYMRSPSKPVSWHIENTGTTISPTELREVCAVVQSEGGYILPGIEFSADIPFRGAEVGQSAERTINSATFTPLMAIRLKANYPAGKPNRKTIRLLDAVFGARSDDISIRMYHVHGLTSCNGTWSDVDDSSVVEYNTTLTSYTAMHKHLVQPASVYSSLGGGGGISDAPIDVLNNHSYINQNYESDNSELIIAEVVTRTGSAAITGHMTWIESE